MQSAGRDRDAFERNDDDPGGQIQIESGYRAVHRANQRKPRLTKRSAPGRPRCQRDGELMFRLTRTQVQPIGLDIGRDAIKMLQLEVVGDSLTAVAGALKEYPAEAKLQATSRMAMLPELLRQMLRQNPFVGRNIVTTLPREFLNVKNLRLPLMPEEELESAVRFEARNIFPFDTEEAQVQCLPAGEVRQGN